MALLLLVIFLIYIYNMDKMIKDLQKENKELKRKLANLADLDKVSVSERELEANNLQAKSVENQQTKFAEAKKELTEEEKLERKLKREKQERETKNTTILITGAILIVLAAIVFLMSTWNTVSNIVAIYKFVN